MFVTFDGQDFEVKEINHKDEVAGYLYKGLVYSEPQEGTREIGTIDTYMGTLIVCKKDSKWWLFLLLGLLAFIVGFISYTLLNRDTSEESPLAEESSVISTFGAYTNDDVYTRPATTTRPAYTYQDEFEGTMEGIMVDEVPESVTNPFESEDVLR